MTDKKTLTDELKARLAAHGDGSMPQEVYDVIDQLERQLALEVCTSRSLRERLDVAERSLSSVTGERDTAQAKVQVVQQMLDVAMSIGLARCETAGTIAIGDAINARARAGAKVVEARETLTRIPKKEEHVRRLAEARLQQAEIEYTIARQVEKVTYVRSIEDGAAQTSQTDEDTTRSGAWPSQRDRWRLKIGRFALVLSAPETQLSLLHDGIAALQSLDNLGTQEANDAAWEDMLELQKRHEELRRRLDKC